MKAGGDDEGIALSQTRRKGSLVQLLLTLLFTWALYFEARTADGSRLARDVDRLLFPP